MSPEAPVLTPDQAEKLLKADLANMVRRVASGQTLTATQRRLAEQYTGQGEFAAVQPATPAFAHSASELARLFDVSRQVVSYHAKQPGSPGRTPDGRYNVEKWRAYLALFGRIPLTAGGHGRPRIGLDYGDACGFAIEAIGEAMLPALKASGVKLAGKALDKVALITWAILAVKIDKALTEWGFPSYFDPDPETGAACYPEAMQRIAARLVRPQNRKN